ncbi:MULTISPECIES: hypothetical protein [unclassified Microcoleus]|uniref:hypothetical protein n=1 Tax=unclassified Microcoleus TaxID=2642155 RepID=UPI002FD617FD
MKIHRTIYGRRLAGDRPENRPQTAKNNFEYKCLQSRRRQSIARRLSLSFGVGLSNLLW